MEEEIYALIANIIEKEFTQEKVLLLLVEDKLKNSYEIQLTKKQKRDLSLYFQEYGLEGLDQLNINLNRVQISNLKRMGHLDLVLDFTESDFDKIDKMVEGTSVVATEAMMNYFSDALLKEWKKEIPTFLKRSKADKREFMSANQQVWGKALDMLETLIDISLDTGEGFYKKFHPVASDEGNFVFDVLIKLHARGCQVGSEILTLLSSGFADGAHARWRTLHELSVIAKFISAHDNKLAERYADHAIIVDYQHALQYRQYSQELSYESMPDEVFDEIKSERENIVEKYGGNAKIFRNDYWWASEILNNNEPNFSHIEDAVDIKFMRPFVKRAHLNVHAGSKGLVYRLGLPPENKNLLLAGASVFGVAEPAQNTTFSMNILTAALLSIYPTYENLGFVSAYEKLMHQVSWAFDGAAEKQLHLPGID